MGFSHSLGRGGCTPVMLFASCFRRDRFVIGARQIFTGRMRDGVNFTGRIQTGGVHAAQPGSTIFTMMAVLRTSRILVRWFRRRRAMNHSANGRSPLPNINISTPRSTSTERRTVSDQ